VIFGDLSFQIKKIIILLLSYLFININEKDDDDDDACVRACVRA